MEKKKVLHKILSVAMIACLLAGSASVGTANWATSTRGAGLAVNAAGINNANDIKLHKVGVVGSFNNWGYDETYTNPNSDFVLTNDGNGKFTGTIVIDKVTEDMMSDVTMDDGIGMQVARTDKDFTKGITFKIRLDNDWTDSWGDYEEAYVRTWNSQTNCAVPAEVGEGLEIKVTFDTTKNCDEAIKAGEVDRYDEVDYTLLPVTYSSKIIDGSHDGTYNGQYGENITYTLDKNGTLTFKGTGNMYASVGGILGTDYKNRKIKNVIISNGITNIGAGTFEGCTNLKSITIPNSVKSIDDSAFERCTALKSITIPNAVTSIGWGTFSGCTGLKNIIIPNSVISVGNWAFSDCTGLKSITIPNSVKSIGESSFYNCTDLTIYGYSGSTAEIYAKKNNIKFISKDQTAATKVTLDRSSLTMGKGETYFLKTTVYPRNISDKSVSYYSNSSKTATVDKNGKITARNAGTARITATTSNGQKAVCIVTVKPAPSKIVESGWCGNDATYTLDVNGTLIISGTGNIYNTDHMRLNNSKVKNLIIKNGITGIENRAFCDFTNLTSVIIPNSVTSIEESAFSNCTSLIKLNIPNNVTYLGRSAFFKCKALTKITIPNSITSIPYATFFGCNSLTNITIPSSVTNIEYYAFSSCLNLTDITVNHNNKNYSSENGVLFNKDKTTIICYPGGKSDKYNIPNGVKSIDVGAFYGDVSLQNITVPSSVTSIEHYAFSFCPNLTDITVNHNNKNYSSENGVLFNKDKTIVICCPAGKLDKYNVPNGVKSIGMGAFYGCVSLNDVTLPNSVTEIGTGAFYECENLESITIPNSVKVVENNAFYGCDKLTIYGYSGSTAQAYAKNNNIKFAHPSKKPKPQPLASKVTLDRSSLTMGKGESYSLKATVAPSNASNKSVSYYSNSSKTVAVDKNGKITARNAGTARITATTSNGQKAVCIVTVKPAPNKITLDKTNLKLGVNETFRLATHINNGAGCAKRTFSSSNSSICSVDSRGNLTAKRTGTATITAKTYNGKTATCKVTVCAAPNKITLDKTNLKLGVNETFRLATHINNGAGCAKRTFSSSNSSVCSVDSRGNLTAKRTGTATITTKTYNGKTATCKVTVAPAPSKITLDKTNLTLNVGKTFRLATHINSGSACAKRTFSSSNSSVCSVDSRGNLTAKKRGTATITAKTYNGKTATCKVTVR